MGLTLKARSSLFPHLKFLRHGKTDPGNCRIYGKVRMLEGVETSNKHEDAKEILSGSNSQGNWAVIICL